MNSINNKWPYRLLESLCVVAFTVSCLSACSSLVSGGKEERLRIELLADGSKQFYYWVGTGYVDPRDEARVLTVRQQRKRNSRSTPGKREYKQLQARAGEVVVRAQYCRDGFLELDFRLASSEYWLRGECRESATALDLERFGELTEIPLG